MGNVKRLKLCASPVTQRLYRTCIHIMFSGYVVLRHRDAYPKMTELPYFLEQACRKASYPYIGKMEMVKDDSKLKSSENHLNDHVLHLQYHMLQFFLMDLSFCYASMHFDQRMSKV